MADFTADVTAWVARANKKMDSVFRAIAEDAVARVKELTPVRTGYLRSNWTAVLKGDAEPVASASGLGTGRIAAAKAGDVITITNPVKYARRIEYGFTGEKKSGGTYHVHGRGMVQQTIAEMPAIAEKALKRFK